jgi:hypothetical protein
MEQCLRQLFILCQIDYDDIETMPIHGKNSEVDRFTWVSDPRSLAGSTLRFSTINSHSALAEAAHHVRIHFSLPDNVDRESNCMNKPTRPGWIKINMSTYVAQRPWIINLPDGYILIKSRVYSKQCFGLSPHRPGTGVKLPKRECIAARGPLWGVELEAGEAERTAQVHHMNVGDWSSLSIHF